MIVFLKEPVIVQYEDCHLHVGYYKDGYPLEGIFFKEKNAMRWHLYFDAESVPIPLHNDYKNIAPFGQLVRVYDVRKMDEVKGNDLFKRFLIEVKIIK